MRLARKWRAESGMWKAVERLEDDLLYISTSEDLQARIPFVLVSE